MEPSMNTPGAQRRIDGVLEPILREHGIRIDAGQKKLPRWLKDRFQLPGIVRCYGERFLDDAFGRVVEYGLDLAVAAHGVEMVVIIEHTNCGERNIQFRKRFKRGPTKEEELLLMLSALNKSERRIQDWYASRPHTGTLHVAKMVATVTASHIAAQRRMDALLTLEEYLEQSPALSESTPLADGLHLGMLTG